MTQDLAQCGRNVETAREKVADAQLQYRRDGKTEPLNAATRALADAHFRYREVSGGRVPDDR